MSHIVTITVQVRDAIAVRAACRRLNLPEPIEGEVKLYSGTVSGLAVQLPDWQYPVCCELSTGQIQYDNFGGTWGEQKHLDAFLQAYAIEKAKLEARRKSYEVMERKQANGDIRLEVVVP